MVNPLARRGTKPFEPPLWIGPAVYWVGVAAATLTAFYMCRLYFLTFWGDFKGWTVGRPSLLARHELGASRQSAHGHDRDVHHDTEAEHAHPPEDLAQPGYPPHESPWQMTVPLIFLAALSVLAGFLNPGFHILHDKPLDHWLEPVFKAATEGAVLFGHGNDKEWAESMELQLALGGVFAFAFGTALAWWMYIARRGEPAKRLAKALPGLYQLVLDKWRIDELYDTTIIAGVDALADTSAAVDKTIVDGILARLTALLVAAAGTILRALQTGVVHVYAGLMVVGVAVVGWFFTVPHPNATVVEAGSDDYLVTAAPGVGYAYRWDADGDGKPDKPDFGPDTTLKVHLLPGKSTTINLEVRNAFGLVKTKAITVERPQAPISSL
jgi:NADH-quinone oxidoreductase subunit L